ncbi:uncharacterized protein LOC131428793 [Malaya genurostris]|uniref:uncharacterized protein LOC131428793 n=1 Tax=Malaya genurostris TaxID=325434 RepID=UPI0026F38006|nr:uncharacterized protein LOC131428793 [Malaya genurostris]
MPRQNQRSAVPDHNCSACDLPDDSKMVSCDECHAWFHFTCVGVTQEIEDHSWSCSKCANDSKKDEHDTGDDLTANNSTDPQPMPNPLLSGTSKVQLAELQLQLLEEEYALERKFLQRKYELLMTTKTGNLGTDSTILPPRHQSSTLPPRLTAPFLNPVNPLLDTATVNDTVLLNQSQIAARHAVSKELPVYNGNPEEWPLFFATFENTTKLCGYTPEENMARLQRCLRGKALDAVRCQLLHPLNLGHVLSTLKMLFGRPEIIVYSLVQKINHIPSPRADKLNSIVDFALAVRNMVATIQACNLEEHLCNITLLQSLVDRLPSMIKLNWATHRQNMKRVTLIEFSDWLYALAEAASAVTVPPLINTTEANHRRGRNDDGFVHAHTVTETGPSSQEFDGTNCIICQGSCPTVGHCKQFLRQDHSSRWALLRNHKLCRCCLKLHKGLCKFSKQCGKDGCPYKHHQLLHNDAKDKSNQHNRSDAQPTETQSIMHSSTELGSNNFNCNTHRTCEKSVLFKYIPVILYNQGRSINTYAFLDSGSSLTLLEESLASDLNLQGERHPLCLRWTADTCRYEDSAIKTSVDVSGIRSADKKYRLSDVYTVKELKLPLQTLPVERLARSHAHLKGIPVDSYVDIQPRILIGVNNTHVVHSLDSREGNEHEPIATKTRLGWIIYGTSLTHTARSSDPIVNFHLCSHSYGGNSSNDDALDDAVKKYFALESLGITKSQKAMLSTEDERALKILRSTTSLCHGRYQTGLLWKYDDVRLPNSKPLAERRHRCLMKKLQRDPELLNILKLKMNDYLEKGYIRKLSSEESMMNNDRIWYLPIFPVFNRNKPGKVRIVWDAAASTGGVSLNSVLLKGPDLLTSLLSVLHKFRERRVAISGDIREMYHQVVINDGDQHCQRFMWCEDDEAGEPSEYIMKVMTFGATCSPSSAQFIMNENATRFEQQFPLAVDAIRRRHYVDDMLTSVDTENEAILLASNVRFIHQQGGFEMRNWMSNSSTVLRALGAARRNDKNMDMDSSQCFEKVLGMWWNTENDVFRYKLSTDRNRELLSGKEIPTKREVLRTLMCTYDPLGLIANYMMPLKILLQEIWRAGTGWDERIGDREFAKWNSWLNMLPYIESVRIPRCYYAPNANNSRQIIELHTFVDTSESGMAAVSYFRFVTENQIYCVLVGSKTRVAPLKFVSIPRLELQAAVIGVRLAQSILQNHTYEIAHGYYWTDARDVICWLKSDHRRYSQFVGFRVGEILESSNTTEWRWLPGKLNVADEATKWQHLPSFDDSNRWFRAPPFLWKPHADWPVSSVNEWTSTEEIRTNLLHHYESPISDILEPKNYSSWKHLIRLTAFVRRFPLNVRRRKIGKYPVTGPLTSDELSDAENRIDESNYAGKYTKHPIVLPRDHPATNLILQEIHNRYHHQCHKTFINEVSRKFYIARVHVACWRIRRECQRCKIRSARPQPPAMGNLPKARLAAYVRPFSYIGVDYFGPMTVVIGRRSEKRWDVLITCLTTRAIHIEIAHSLSADSCIMAIRNCISRRGTPVQIVSDRGTNFIKADKELKKGLAGLDQERMIAELTTPETSWTFNPPASPHMGGCWERLIQSVKRVLAEIRPTRPPSDEVLRNTMLEIENIINSRPLTQVPIDHESSPALTPNHFLCFSFTTELEGVANIGKRVLEKVGSGLPTNDHPEN